MGFNLAFKGLTTLQKPTGFEQVRQWYPWRRCNKHRNM